MIASIQRTISRVGRKRKTAHLDIYVGSTRVGEYARSANGSTSFRYITEWVDSQKAFPISISMPLSDRLWRGREVSTFFDGLLPDEPVVRNKIASRESADSGSTFDLLSVIGRDCVGALRFIPEGRDPGNPTEMNYKPISDTDIAKRIATLDTAPLGVNAENDFRISIAGVQEKTAFLKVDGQWQLPVGATPTSHIFKPRMKSAVADFADSPWNEWFCLGLCRELGLNTTKADVILLDNKPVLVVERFDRAWKNGVLYRLPQEDMCQALGVSPTAKYQSEGGPSVIDIMNLLNGAISPLEDKVHFYNALVVFWLMAAIDGHAKNFSIFLTPGGYKLTPLYDVMSVAPYKSLSLHKAKLAMSFGDKGYYRLKQIQPRHLLQTAKLSGLHEGLVNDQIALILSRIDDAVQRVVVLSKKAGMPQDTAEKIVATVLTQAKKLKESIG